MFQRLDGPLTSDVKEIARIGAKGNRLLNDIENSPLKNDALTVWRLGGAGVAIRSGPALIYIDPYLVRPKRDSGSHRAIPVPFYPEMISKADAVLSTHEHDDHCNERTLMSIQKNTAAVFFG